MRNIPMAIYRRSAEIKGRIRQLEDDTLRIHMKTEELRMLVQEISKLRLYANAKLWMASPQVRAAMAAVKEEH